MNNRLKGAYYEERAAAFLKSLGFDILSRNYRSPAGEIDIIAGRNGIISFIEVKYRATDAFGIPSEAVDRKKQMRTAAAAIKKITAPPFHFTPLFIVPPDETDCLDSA